MGAKSFKAVLQHTPEKRNWAFVDIPFDVKKEFGKKGRTPVKVNVDGYNYLSTITPRKNGKHFLYVNITIRDSIGKNPGDIVKVTIIPDIKERTVEIPAAFQKAMDDCPGAKKTFEKYSYSHKKEFIDWLLDAKKEETRMKRIENAIKVLS